MGHNVWQELVCDKCFKAEDSHLCYPHPPGSHLINMETMGRVQFLEMMKERGWVLKDGQWICPLCAQRMREKGLL